MIPVNIEEKINNFKTIRKNYFNDYEIWKEQEESKKNQDQTFCPSSSNFTQDELNAVSISLNYENVEKSVKKNYHSVRLYTPSPYRFNHFGDQYRIHDFNDNFNNTHRAKPKITITLQERYRKMFNDCITMINHLHIFIYKIKYKLKNLIRDTTIYVFYCKKGNSHFKFQCFENEDHKLGCLSCYKTIDKITQVKTQHYLYFDLNHDIDTTNYNYKKFMAVINGMTVKEFNINCMLTIKNYHSY